MLATVKVILWERENDAQVTAERIAAFAKVMQENVRDGEIAFRRAYIRAVIDQVEVDDKEIRVHGHRSALEKLLMSSRVAPAGVPSFVRKWRAGPEANALPHCAVESRRAANDKVPAR